MTGDQEQNGWTVVCKGVYCQRDPGSRPSNELGADVEHYVYSPGGSSLRAGTEAAPRKQA